MSGADLNEEREARLRRIQAYVAAGDREGLAQYVRPLHPSDIADVIETLEPEAERVALLDALPAESASAALAEMEHVARPETLLAALPPERIGELVAELPDDDAVDLIGELEPEARAKVLAALPGVEVVELERLLRYDEETAGGLMTTELIAVSSHLTAGQAIGEVRRQARDLDDEFYTIFVVDPRRRFLGTVPLRSLVLTEPDTPLAQLVEEPVAVVPADMDREEVGRLIARYDLPSVAVVGPEEVLLGRITWDDVLDVIEAEQTEDILRFGGVTADEEVLGGWVQAVKSRLPWLFVNLGTAVLAGAVVYVFKRTIEAAAVLAAIMPVIAGMGGNAATQTLAVTVRRLALEGDLSGTHWDVVGKELLVGLVNGVVLGVFSGLVSYWWLGSFSLGYIVLLAMWGNLVIAALGGAFIPILLDRIGIDPAVASTVFVTTLTDLGGFFLLLGLASRFLA